jgi:hypothetical protein
MSPGCRKRLLLAHFKKFHGENWKEIRATLPVKTRDIEPPEIAVAETAKLRETSFLTSVASAVKIPEAKSAKAPEIIETEIPEVVQIIEIISPAKRIKLAAEPVEPAFKPSTLPKKEKKTSKKRTYFGKKDQTKAPIDAQETENDRNES